MVIGRVMASKLYTGHPSLRLQFFEKRSVLYVRIETFNVSVYDPCNTTRSVDIMDLPGKVRELQTESRRDEQWFKKLGKVRRVGHSFKL